MSWLSSILGAIISKVAAEPNYERSAITFVKNLGEQLLANAHLPAAITQIGHDLIEKAATVVGAQVVNTPMASQVSPATLAAANDPAGAHNPGD